MQDTPPRRDKTAPPSRTVFDGANLRAFIWEGTAPRLIVTFDHFDNSRNGYTRFANASVFDDPAAHLLHIQSARNDWYLNADLAPMMAALSGLGRFEAVSLAGFSMGGYGAFLFSGVLGATRILAVSPQSAVAPERAPFETRWASERAGLDPVADDLARHVAPGVRGHVLFDPRQPPDELHALSLAALVPGVMPVPVPYSGHPATRIFSETRGWEDLLACLDGVEPVRAVSRARRARRAFAPFWWWKVAAHSMQRGRRELALKAIERMAELPNVKPAYLFAAGSRLARMGDREGIDVMEHAERLMREPPAEWRRRIRRAIAELEDG